MTILAIKGVTKDFGGLRAIDQVSLEVQRGEILGLIGPNGAGKTTLFNVITGFYKPTSGRVIFKGEDVTGLKPNQIAEKGLVRTFQATTLFRENTVLENMRLGFHLEQKLNFWEELLKTSRQRRKGKEIREQTLAILDFMKLEPFKDHLAKNLPYGYQRALGVSIALATNPELLLLDEPVCGMNAEETELMMGHIRRVHEEKKVTMIIVEHDMKVIMGLSDRIAVLNYGKKITEGPPAEIQENKMVIEAYLGAEEG
jgi:branched-chain amino acid transport system ATP-binding protein